MAIDTSKCPLSSERAAPPTALAAASALGQLVRLLACQAAREVIASGLGAYRVAPEETASETSPALDSRTSK
jgi:hypothetical protein